MINFLLKLINKFKLHLKKIKANVQILNSHQMHIKINEKIPL